MAQRRPLSSCTAWSSSRAKVSPSRDSHGLAIGTRATAGSTRASHHCCSTSRSVMSPSSSSIGCRQHQPRRQHPRPGDDVRGARERHPREPLPDEPHHRALAPRGHRPQARIGQRPQGARFLFCESPVRPQSSHRGHTKEKVVYLRQCRGRLQVRRRRRLEQGLPWHSSRTVYPSSTFRSHPSGGRVGGATGAAGAGTSIAGDGFVSSGSSDSSRLSISSPHESIRSTSVATWDSS